MLNSFISKKMTKTKISKALNLAKTISIQRKHDDLELLISQEHRNPHFIADLRELGPTLE